ncbi:hypothetical protein CK218_27740 [Mesorhizobium sp. WSM3879]|nr:hypothetical protein CK218_27740 [Mesorhizobium sp. WSM3879]
MPADAIVFLDFVNGHYFAGSAQRAIATLLGGGFDPAYITADGMQITTDNLPTARGQLFAEFEGGLAAGMTILFEFSQTTNSAFSNSHFLISFEDLPSPDWSLQVERTNFSGTTPNDDFFVGDFGSLFFSDHVAEALASGTNRFAVTLGRDLGGGTWRYAASFNGSAALTADVGYSAAEGFATNGLSVVRIGGRFDAWPDGFIRSIRLYPAVDETELEALSA